jgi:hypothetical protein
LLNAFRLFLNFKTVTTQLTAMQSRTKQLQQQHETEQKIVIETTSLHHNHISTIVNVLVQLQNNQGQRNQVSQVQQMKKKEREHSAGQKGAPATTTNNKR